MYASEDRFDFTVYIGFQIRCYTFLKAKLTAENLFRREAKIGEILSNRDE